MPWVTAGASWWAPRRRPTSLPSSAMSGERWTGTWYHDRELPAGTPGELPIRRTWRVVAQALLPAGSRLISTLLRAPAQAPARVPARQPERLRHDPFHERSRRRGLIPHALAPSPVLALRPRYPRHRGREHPARRRVGLRTRARGMRRTRRVRPLPGPHSRRAGPGVPRAPARIRLAR